MVRSVLVCIMPPNNSLSCKYIRMNESGLFDKPVLSEVEGLRAAQLEAVSLSRRNCFVYSRF
jgi:hypothetical protein